MSHFPETLLSFYLLTDEFRRQGFGRGPSKNTQPRPPPSPLPASYAAVPATTTSSLGTDPPAPEPSENIKYFFQEKYSPLNVKGNFLTLCACPKNVELGEWLAHQGALIL